MKAVKDMKAVAKLMDAAHVSEFKKDKMEREDMLDVIPHPALTPAGDCVGVWASGSSSGGRIIESNIDTDELNPNKGAYKPSTTKDDTDDLSMVPILPPQKMTYMKPQTPEPRQGQLRPWR